MGPSSSPNPLYSLLGSASTVEWKAQPIGVDDLPDGLAGLPASCIIAEPVLGVLAGLENLRR